LLRVAPYCAAGGIRVVSILPSYRPSDLRVELQPGLPGNESELYVADEHSRIGHRRRRASVLRLATGTITPTIRRWAKPIFLRVPTCQPNEARPILEACSCHVGWSASESCESANTRSKKSSSGVTSYSQLGAGEWKRWSRFLAPPARGGFSRSAACSRDDEHLATNALRHGVAFAEIPSRQQHLFAAQRSHFRGVRSNRIIIRTQT
jgi:hypothetical protein